MSEAVLFAKGLAIGVAVAAPVGPIGALCVRRAISIGKMAAIGTGMGAAVADAFYGAVAAFGLTAISDLLVSYQDYAAGIGGVFLLYLAWRIFKSAGPEVAAGEKVESFSLVPAFLSTAFLTLTNPATILSFAAIFTGIGFLQDVGSNLSAMILVGGVFLGSAIWWVFLAFFAYEMKKRLGARFVVFVNWASGLLLLIFGLLALTSLVI